MYDLQEMAVFDTNDLLKARGFSAGRCAVSKCSLQRPHGDMGGISAFAARLALLRSYGLQTCVPPTNRLPIAGKTRVGDLRRGTVSFQFEDRQRDHCRIRTWHDAGHVSRAHPEGVTYDNAGLRLVDSLLPGAIFGR